MIAEALPTAMPISESLALGDRSILDLQQHQETGQDKNQHVEVPPSPAGHGHQHGEGEYNGCHYYQIHPVRDLSVPMIPENPGCVLDKNNK